jgi:hypothetical protein
MANLLVLYTQVDQLIMEVCAERIACAPSQGARLGLARQVGDESQHVRIQQEWMQRLGISATPLIEEISLEQFRAHFRSLNWVDFLTDLYLVIEALGSQAVEQIVPLADPGTRESLRIPLQDELDHVAFGMQELKTALAGLDETQRGYIIEQIPERIDHLVSMLQQLNLPVRGWFEQVGADYQAVCRQLDLRRQELFTELAA